MRGNEDNGWVLAVQLAHRLTYQKNESMVRVKHIVFGIQYSVTY